MYTKVLTVVSMFGVIIDDQLLFFVFPKLFSLSKEIFKNRLPLKKEKTGLLQISPLKTTHKKQGKSLFRI